jgi:hypothetical protein
MWKLTLSRTFRVLCGGRSSTSLSLTFGVEDCVWIMCVQLKYHDTGREKECQPQAGQWNMMHKVCDIMLWFNFHS